MFLIPRPRFLRRLPATIEPRCNGWLDEAEQLLDDGHPIAAALLARLALESQDRRRPQGPYRIRSAMRAENHTLPNGGTD